MECIIYLNYVFFSNLDIYIKQKKKSKNYFNLNINFSCKIY